MNINPDIFRQYDIRGIVGRDLTPQTVTLLGKGIGSLYREHGKKTVALGWDCRLSSPEFAQVLSHALRSTGCQVINLGTVPTPLLYFAIYHKKFDAGIMITGSHNPPEYNGFKIMLGQDTLFGDSIQDILRLIQEERYTEDELGTEKDLDITPEYIDHVVSDIHLERSLSVVVDAGNGTGGSVAVPIFRKLGCEVRELYCEMDGNFPNHHPDPTLPEALEDLIVTVKENDADLGIAYDGDADRIGAIDDTGSIIWGDQLMVLFVRDILPAHPGATIISEVKASKVLYDEIEKLGGHPIMWKTGHSFIKKKIKEEKALLAGEMSGHIFFADRYFGYDDAIYSSARLLEILSRKDIPFSKLLADLPKTFHTPEIRVYASDKVKFKIVDEVKKDLAQRHPIIDIDGVRANFPHGWALVRASNTQEVLVMRFEADTKESLESIRQEVKTSVAEVIRRLENS
jgi:phosphomannomutase/phosphoglucomutase